MTYPCFKMKMENLIFENFDIIYSKAIQNVFLITWEGWGAMANVA